MNVTPNKEQKSAIEAEFGPVLIIAGAGTGKTFTITERILYLIKEKNINANSILALTFTEKAAHEMEERVDKRLPIGFVDMQISTFHSFCDRFIKEEAINVGMSPDYSIMTQNDEIFFIKKHIFDFDFELYRPKGNPNKFVSELAKHVSRLQDEGILPDDYEKFYLDNAGKMDELEKRKYFELSHFYKKYTEIKIKEGKMSFGDLISITLETLKKRPDILKKWRNFYKYVLVDEFQDTNLSQYEIIKLLVKGKEYENIMAVADDDQSIYKFRGAAISNVLKFSEDFPNAKRVVLKENRRSVQEVLDASYRLIQNNNPDRLEVKENIDKQLIEKGEGMKRVPEPVEVRWYNNYEDESFGIAQEIVDLVGANKMDVKEEQYQLGFHAPHQPSRAFGSGQAIFKFSDIVVLMRSHSASDNLTKVFRRNNIPYQFSGARKLFNREEIKWLINYLKVTSDYSDNIAMNGLMDMPIWQFNQRDLIEINIQAKKSQTSIFEMFESIDETSEVKYRFNIESAQKIVDFVKKSWDAMKEGKSTWQVLYDFVHTCGIIEYFSKEEDSETDKDKVVIDLTEDLENEFKIKNITRLFEYVDKFEKLNPDRKLQDFVEYLELVLESGDSPLVDDIEMEERNAVKIMTVHASKGLEFPVVFIPLNVRGKFPSREMSEKLEIPQELVKDIVPEGDYHLQEERRLMYVAITRAKYKAYLTGASFYGEGKRKSKISPFLVEVIGEEKASELLENPIILNKSIITEEGTEPFSKSQNKEKKTTKNISYSQIQDYKTCPRKYMYRYVLQIPSPPNASLSYGNSVHNTLKNFYQIVKDSKLGITQPEELTKKNFLKIFRENWIRAGYNNLAHEEKSYRMGQKSMELFYENFFKNSQSPAYLEQSFKLDVGGIKLVGKIDRIDIVEESGSEFYEIIDYKTGDKERTQKEVDKDMQLAIYALAAQKAFGIDPKKYSLLLIDKNKKISTDASNLDKIKDKIVEVIGEVVEKIKQEDYTATPGFQCKFCDYRNICKYAQL